MKNQKQKRLECETDCETQKTNKKRVTLMPQKGCKIEMCVQE